MNEYDAPVEAAPTYCYLAAEGGMNEYDAPVEPAPTYCYLAAEGDMNEYDAPVEPATTYCCLAAEGGMNEYDAPAEPAHTWALEALSSQPALLDAFTNRSLFSLLNSAVEVRILAFTHSSLRSVLQPSSHLQSLRTSAIEVGVLALTHLSLCSVLPPSSHSESLLRCDRCRHGGIHLFISPFNPFSVHLSWEPAQASVKSRHYT